VTRGGIILRDAEERDLPAILEIHNHAIRNETSIWNDDVADVAERRAWLEARRARGFPVYVAELDGILAGYGTFGDFRPHQGYRSRSSIRSMSPHRLDAAASVALFCNA
jgi:L-amino acid N-acyltransferase